jgi:hypothetical protein
MVYNDKEKSDLTDKVLPFLKNLKLNKNLKFVRINNAGENMLLGKELENLGFQVEYTAPNIPQKNGVVERATATSIARTRAMLIEAGF